MIKNGKFSRGKGKRAEYLVRDAFRAMGYTADRVPSSGAAPGFKGDVKVTREDGSSFLVEVKSRAKGFEEMYNLQPNYFWLDNDLISISTFFSDVVPGANRSYHPPAAMDVKNVKKLASFQKWLGKCDYLVIKADYKPLLFIRYEKLLYKAD